MSVVSLLGYLNSALNPILYAMALRDVRNAAWKAYAMCVGWFRSDRLHLLCYGCTRSGTRNHIHNANDPTRTPAAPFGGGLAAASAAQHPTSHQEHPMLERSGWQIRHERSPNYNPPNTSRLVCNCTNVSTSTAYSRFTISIYNEVI